MKKPLRIGIAGCGSIGSSLARIVSGAGDFAGKAAIAGLFDVETEKAYRLAKEIQDQKAAVLTLDELIQRSDLVVEASHADSAYTIAKKVLSAGRSILVMSVGGIIEHYRELEALAGEKNARIHIPSGAILGIDGLKAAGCGKITKVTLTTRKPPQAFIGVPYVLKKKIRLDALREDTVLFEGDAFSAARAFPQNINVASVLSIAGIGPEQTRVRIVASVHVTRNTHEIEVESDAGKFFTRSENVVQPDNPKTSYLAVLSAVATLKQAVRPMQVGT